MNAVFFLKAKQQDLGRGPANSSVKPSSILRRDGESMIHYIYIYVDRLLVVSVASWLVLAGIVTYSTVGTEPSKTEVLAKVALGALSR